MEDRIKINKEEGLEIEIAAYYDNQKQSLLILWMILWSMAGIGIASQFFFPGTEDMKMYLFVWLAFWLYFEYKVIYAYRWRRFGKERFYFENDRLIISREISGRSIPLPYEADFIKDMRIREENPRAFFTAMSQSYWSPGGEKIIFSYKGKDVFLGMELSNAESKMIVKTLWNKVKELKS